MPNNEFRPRFRKVEVTYIQGAEETGKTHHVYGQHGYNDIHTIRDPYGCFNHYYTQDVLLFDDFESKNFHIRQMNNWLDIYPLMLLAKYFNREARYTKVYIISRTPLEKLYLKEQETDVHGWKAFIGHIDRVLVFKALGEYEEFTTEKYLETRGSQ